jgi:hypothetical protein
MIPSMSGKRFILVLALVLNAVVAVASPVFWPTRATGDGAIRTPVLADCRVHAVTGEGTETLHACGVPVSLPPRATLVWIEQGNAISGQVTPAGSGDVDLPLVPAGTVQLTVETGKESAQQQRTVRLDHAGKVMFTRMLRVGAAGQRVSMPEGTALALEVDSHGDVSRLAVGKLVAGKMTAIRPASPAQGAALVGIFTIPSVVATATDPGAFVVGVERTPELVVDHGSELVTLWRGLAAGPNELTLRSAAYQFAPASLRLRERNVATFRAELRPLPSLTVKIAVPEEALPAWKDLHPSLVIRRTADKKVVRQSDDATTDQDFSLLPLDSYDAVLTAKPWTFVRRADLTGGTDGTVEFAPQPFTISGKVTVGEEPKAASVAFRRGNGDTTRAHTDANGEYEVTLWMSDMYIVEATLDDDAAQPPFSRATRLWSTRTIDIHLPMTKVLVRATDAASGEPVADAEVTTFNRWDDPATGKGGASHTVKTDANGVARLAPLSRGTAEIHVKADGYFKDEPTTIAVTDDTVEQTVAVKLRPAGATSDVRISLPTGTPAPEAEVLVVGDRAGSQILWSGRADGEGRVSVPRSLAGSIVLVRHPAAAGLARRFQDLPEQEYQLAPASPRPLVVEVERHGARTGNVSITVWINGLPLTGGALEFLLQSPAMVPNSGLWTGLNLPREPVRILVSSGRIDAAIAAGAYDALATVVPEPRPNQVTLTVVD